MNEWINECMNENVKKTSSEWSFGASHFPVDNPHNAIEFDFFSHCEFMMLGGFVVIFISSFSDGTSEC